MCRKVRVGIVNDLSALQDVALCPVAYHYTPRLRLDTQGRQQLVCQPTDDSVSKTGQKGRVPTVSLPSAGVVVMIVIASLGVYPVGATPTLYSC